MKTKLKLILAALVAVTTTTNATTITYAWNSHNAVSIYIDGVSVPGSDSGSLMSVKGARAWWDVESDGTTVTLMLSTDTAGIDMPPTEFSWPATGSGPYGFGFDVLVYSRPVQDGWWFSYSSFPHVYEQFLPDVSVPDSGNMLVFLGAGISALAFVRRRI